MTMIRTNTLKLYYTLSSASRKLALTIPIVFALMIVQAFGFSAEQSQVLVTVNDDTIQTLDLEREIIKVHSSLDGEKKASFDYSRLIDKLINDRLIIQEALALGLDQEPRVSKRLKREQANAAIRAYVSDHFKPDLSIADRVILEHFNKNYSQLQVRTISVATRDEALEIARSIRGGASMDSIARDISLDTRRYRGGLHNIKFWSDVEAELRLQAMKLDVGQLSDPFTYREVYAVLRVEYVAPGDTSQLPQHKSTVESALKRRRKEAAWKGFLTSLAEKYPISTDSTVLGKILSDSMSVYSSDFRTTADDIVMRADETHFITAGNLRRRISQSAMTNSKKSVTQIIDNAVAECKEELLLGSAAQTENYYSDPRVQDAYQHNLDSSMIETYLQEMIVPQIIFKRAEFEEYYRNHPDELREPSKYQLGRIIVSDRIAADEVVQRLADGADFDFLARQYSENPGLEESAREWVTLERFPPSVKDEISGLKAGQSSQAYQSVDGYVIFDVKAVRQGNILPMEAVEMKIREVMFQRKFNEILDHTLKVLKDGSKIQYNAEAIDEYFNADKF